MHDIMRVAATITASIAVESRFREHVSTLNLASESYFLEKDYGKDLRELFIGVICVESKFEDFFKGRLPEYRKQEKQYVQQGVLVQTNPFTFMYSKKLDYDSYLKLENEAFCNLLARDILASLTDINSCKQIKDFDFDDFYSSFERFFVELNWILVV